MFYLYCREFVCNIVLCNRQRLGQNAAQKAVLLWSDVSCIVRSCASVSLQAAILLTSSWQTSQYPWLSVRDSHTNLAEASTLSLSLFIRFSTAKEKQNSEDCHVWKCSCLVSIFRLAWDISVLLYAFSILPKTLCKDYLYSFRILVISVFL